MRIQRLTDWLRDAGRTSVLWAAGALPGCLCENEDAEPCGICAAVAKGDQFDLRAARAALRADAQRAAGDTMPTPAQFEIFEDDNGYFRWHVKSRSGDVLGSSCEAFVVREDCAANAADLAAILVCHMAHELAGR